MFTCSQCKLKFDTVSILCKHIRSLCYKSNGSSFVCGEDGCLRHYSCLASLRKHLLKSHSSQAEPVTQNEVVTLHEETISHENEEIQSSSNHIDLTHQIALFVSTLYANPLFPRSNVQVVLESMQKLIIDPLGNSLKSSLYDLVGDNQDKKKGVDQILDNVHNLLQDFTTEHKRINYFTQLGIYVPSYQVIVGQHMEQKRTRIGLSYMPTNCTMQVIPLNLILKRFFSMSDVLKDLLLYRDKLINSDLTEVSNIIQGSVWQSCTNQHPINNCNEILLPLVVYYDDFEISNPLGSRAGVHKLGGVYMSCPCLPPDYVSHLANIFIVALFHSSDKVSFGNQIIFQKVIEELNFLSKTGITIDTDVFKGVVKFRVAAITGDNLGLNSILGFVESFSANHPCRICTADRQQIQRMCVEDITLFRNESNYESMLQAEYSTYESGIKERCVWQALEGFNLFSNVAVDLLHDMLEGCCKYVMSFIITYFVKDLKLIHINTLNQRIAAFDFGPDSDSKPTALLTFEGSALKIKMSASEMLVFVRYFGLILGYYIPRENEVWHLYILLRTILDRLLSHRIYTDTCEQLTGMIAEFNELYMRLSKEPLKPKFHFLLHYPTMLKKFGPATHIWTMRFEAKHSIAKKIARSSHNKINICKTILIKHQLQLSHVFLRNEKSKCFQFGKKNKLSPNMSNLLKGKFNIESDSHLVCSVTWVKAYNNLFKQSAVIIVSLSEETFLPSFAIINEIFLDNNEQVWFSCTSLDTNYFDEHYFAYNVTHSNAPLYIAFRNLLAPVPCSMNVMTDLLSYVTVRWSLD